MRCRNVAQLLLVGVALSGVITACGSSGSGGSAASAIKTNWETFFNPKTPVAKRVSLLQNGPAFESWIRAQAKSPLAASTSATVSRVTHITGNQARVTYSIRAGGTPVLRNKTGVAVYHDGVWQVGDASFCDLLALENHGSATKLPSYCKV